MKFHIIQPTGFLKMSVFYNFAGCAVHIFAAQNKPIHESKPYHR